MPRITRTSLPRGKAPKLKKHIKRVRSAKRSLAAGNNKPGAKMRKFVAKKRAALRSIGAPIPNRGTTRRPTKSRVRRK